MTEQESVAATEAASDESAPGPAFETEVAESLAAAASVPSSADSDGRKPVESWAIELKTPDWLFAAAKMLAQWPRGRELTKAEYQSAVAAVDQVICR